MLWRNQASEMVLVKVSCQVVVHLLQARNQEGWDVFGPVSTLQWQLHPEESVLVPFHSTNKVWAPWRAGLCAGYWGQSEEKTQPWPEGAQRPPRKQKGFIANPGEEGGMTSLHKNETTKKQSTWLSSQSTYLKEKNTHFDIDVLVFVDKSSPLMFTLMSPFFWKS